MTLPRPATSAVLLALVLTGCGGSGPAAEVRDVPKPSGATTTPAPAGADATTTTPSPTTTGATGATGPVAPAATTPSGTTPEPGGASGDETQPGGAGDEEPIRQPARFVLTATDLQPASIAVAPFLAVALTVVNRDPVAHTVKLIGTTTTFTVPAGGRDERRLAGLAAGTYTVSVDGGRTAASLVVGDAAGP